MATARLTHEEFSHLLRLATADQALSIRFGPDWIELDTEVAFGKWAILELDKIRGGV